VKRNIFREIKYLSRLGESRHVVHLYDFEHNQLGEDTLYMLLEKGESDLGQILSGLERDQERDSPIFKNYS
jgi:serine/threonine protein kinase